MFRTVLAAAFVTLTAAPALAQLRPARVLSAEAARNAVQAAEAHARQNGWAVSIAVVDASGELVAFLRMDGASPASVDISRGKARTAARLRRPTRAIEDAVAGGRSVMMTIEGVVALEGGVPIVIEGVVIGAVGVSGVTSVQDGQVAQAGVEAVRP